MEDIIVKHYKHKEKEHTHKVVLEINTECDVLAESSYNYLCAVAKDMESTLKKLDPLIDTLNKLKRFVDEVDESDGD